MELVPEGLFCCKELRVPDCAGISRKNRGAGESKQMVLLEALYDSRVHIAKLAAVAFIEDDHDMLLIYIMDRILLDEGGELLNRSDDDMGIRIFQLSLQDHSAGVTIGSSFLETVIFLHGLVVQILTVYNKEDLIDIRKLRSLTGSLK